MREDEREMKMTLSREARFWDRMANRYAKSPIADPVAYEEKLRLTQERLSPEMRVLEVGCGTGGTALRHAPFVREVHAIDVSPRMIAIANAKKAEAGIGNVRFDVDDLHGFTPDGVRYDAVLAMSILHLVSDRDVALAKIRSLLQPGDLFVSSTVCMGDDLKIFKWIAPIGKALRLFPTVRVFTSDALAHSITAAGFDIRHRWKPGPRTATFLVATAR